MPNKAWFFMAATAINAGFTRYQIGMYLELVFVGGMFLSMLPTWRRMNLQLESIEESEKPCDISDTRDYCARCGHPDGLVVSSCACCRDTRAREMPTFKTVEEADAWAERLRIVSNGTLFKPGDPCLSCASRATLFDGEPVCNYCRSSGEAVAAIW